LEFLFVLFSIFKTLLFLVFIRVPTQLNSFFISLFEPIMVFTRALVVVAFAQCAGADDTCAADGTCSDELAMLQHQSGAGLKTVVQHKKYDRMKADDLDDPRLLAYHDAGSCGPMGNDHNVAWCGGASVRECPQTVETDICLSGTAVLASNQVGGNFAVGDCRYWLYAQYRCQDDPRLLAYHDAGSCGPMGNDHNVAWCGGANVRKCPHIVDTVDTDICPSGSALLASNQVGGNFAVGDCRYWLYAQYQCLDDPRLLAYHDAGSCGPMGNDHNVAWCGGPNVRECPATVETDICPSGSAFLASNQVGGHFAVGDCRYWLYAQYRC